jgi:hypothetical protein
MSAYRTPVALPVFHPCKHPFVTQEGVRMEDVRQKDIDHRCKCNVCGAKRGICAFAENHDWEERDPYGPVVCSVCGTE